MSEPIHYQPEDIIHFPHGLPGFEKARDFLIFSRPEHQPFHWMQEVHAPELQFVLVNPLQLRADYDPALPAHALEDLEVREPGDLLLYTMVTFAPKLQDSTANLLGPIFINIRTRTGKQIVLDDDRYSVQERILR